MMRVVIADDEPMARGKLRRLLAAHADVEVLAEAVDAVTVIEAVRLQRPDVLILDIDMPGMSGMDVIRALPAGEQPWVIFATAHPQFALQGFEVGAIDYLLKPFDAERLDRALQRARERVAPAPASSSAVAEPRAWPTRLLVPDGREQRIVRVDEIDWVGSADNYAEVHVGPEVYLIREPLRSIAARLDPATFLRVHRGAIVNLDRVDAIRTHAGRGEEVVLRDGTPISVGRAYRESLLQRWHR